MAQDTINRLVAVMFTLSLQEQEFIVEQIQKNISLEKERQQRLEGKPYTWDELRTRVQEALDQYHRGEYYSDEEDDTLFDEFLRGELQVAVWKSL